MYTQNSITNILLQATNYAISQGFNPIYFKGEDETPEDFMTALFTIANDIHTDFIHSNKTYAALCFTHDTHQFWLDPYKSQEELLENYKDLPDATIMATFKTIIEDKLFTLDIVLG